ncbi:hypothetical protein QTP88_026820 [Uroleucon formosanum]
MYGSTSYLSFSVYEKFIEMMGEKVKNTIINEIKNAKYFSIVVDSTPDISHTDQLACIFRYVKTNGEPVERFLQFITNSGHKSEDLADAIFMVIGENELDIKNCRGQSYDNASNMSAHSLNLVGEYAANCCTLGTEFFNFLQALYTFFSASTYRWEILSDYLTNSKNKTVKRLSDTRWAARHEACSSLSQNWTELLKALNSFVENPIENSKTKCESTGLIKKMNRLEMCILVSFWNDILERFNSTSKKLQTIEIDLTIVINLYTSLINYVTDLRNTFSHYEKLAMEKSEIKEYKVVRKKKRKIPYDESCQDSLLSELRKRKSCYDDINTMFGFFSNMIDLPVIEVRKKATKLQSQYPEDLDGSFINECIHFHGYLKSLPGIVSPKSILELCKIIEDHNIADVYPYVDIALRMYLCCPVSNTSAERSFSVLKRVKSYLRSSMNDNRLNNLAILNIECEITKSISYNEVIEDFAAQKSHHVLFKQRAVIEFLVAENVKPVDIHRRLLAVYGNQTLDVSSVRRLALRVKGSEVGKAIIADQDRSGRPVTVTDEAHKQKVDDLVKGNRRIKQSEIAIALGISKERVQHILCELEYRKICARWVPKMLTEEMKQNRVEICRQFLLRFDRERENFLNIIVTGDESWVHHYNPENKRQSMEFRHKTSPAPKNRVTMAAIESLGFQVIPHPPYNQDLAPCDFFLFPKLKEHLKGTKFNSDEKVKAEVKRWFNAQPEEFYLNGISKLVNRWQKCIALEGSYVEK